MKNGLRLLAASAALLLALSLTGCNILVGDVENLLSPPRTGDQEQLQQALEDSFGNAQRYTLQYPQKGDYRSAFIFRDLDGDGTDEAIALYQPAESDNTTHINLLRLEEDRWVSVSDIAGEGTDISQVRFGDLNGDGRLELLVSWSLYSTRHQQFTLYLVESDKLTARSVGTYTDVYMGDITASGRDSLLLFTIDTAKTDVRAELKVLQNNALTVLGEVHMDGYVQQLVHFTLGRLDETVNGVYVDCQKDTGAYITELVYWDGERLNAPLYNAELNISVQKGRRQMIPAMDVDSDGEVEWPVCELLPGYTDETAADAMWMTYWNAFEYDTHQIREDLFGIVDLTDGYCLRIDRGWDGRVTATYDAAAHELQLQTAAGQKPILIVRTEMTAGGTSSSADAQGDRVFQSLGGSGNARYSVWFETQGEFALSLDRVRYMLLLLVDQA